MRRVADVLLRVLCLTMCLVGLAFVLSVLSGSRNAHAQSVPGEETTMSNGTPLWADPSTLSATAMRRASGGGAEPAQGSVAPTATPVDHPSTPSGFTPGTGAFEGLVAVTTPIGSLGAGGSGAPDSGPSITQLAVLSAALMGVRWLSQRFRAIELSWRNALMTLQIERPG